MSYRQRLILTTPEGKPTTVLFNTDTVFKFEEETYTVPIFNEDIKKIEEEITDYAEEIGLESRGKVAMYRVSVIYPDKHIFERPTSGNNKIKLSSTDNEETFLGCSFRAVNGDATFNVIQTQDEVSDAMLCELEEDHHKSSGFKERQEACVYKLAVETKKQAFAKLKELLIEQQQNKSGPAP